MFLNIFLLVIGAGLFYTGINTLRLRKRVYSWPAIEGKLISKSVGKIKLSGAGRGASHVVNVEYEFEFQNKKYSGNKYYAIELIGGERAMMQRAVEKTLAKMGDTVSVFYNPQNPAESYLIKDNPWFMYLSLIVGAIMLISAIVGFM